MEIRPCPSFFPSAKKDFRPTVVPSFLRNIFTSFSGVMTELQRNILTKSWDKIVENVRSQDIVDDLIQVILNAVHSFALNKK